MLKEKQNCVVGPPRVSLEERADGCTQAPDAQINRDDGDDGGDGGDGDGTIAGPVLIALCVYSS